MKESNHQPPAQFAASVWCAELELSGDRLASPTPTNAGFQGSRVLIRLHGLPLGYLSAGTPAEQLSVAGLRAQALERWPSEIAEHLRADGLELPDAGRVGGPALLIGSCAQANSTDRRVSVVVGTRNRSERLAGCLDSLRELSYPQLEILIVDNASDDERTREVVLKAAVADPRVRYVGEPVPGVSRARNRGLAEATGEIVAFTDDDVTVTPGWVDGLVRGFERSDAVRCVTGLVCTASISNEFEAYFDARTASWSTRTQSELFEAGSRRFGPLYPYGAGMFGTGANLAFDRLHLLALGGFDEALGPGTPAQGGEDLDLFCRSILAGASLCYEPSAVVWHHHRADAAGLQAQMYGYGLGLTAYLAKLLFARQTRRDLLSRVPAGLRHVAYLRRRTADRGGATVAPAGVVRREFAGYLSGPVGYVRARRRRSRLAAVPA